MKLLFTFFFCSIGLSMSAQLTVNTDTLGITAKNNYRYVAKAKMWNETANNLNSVTVKTNGGKYNAAHPPIGMERMSLKDIKNIPVFFGEKDLMKTLQLLPGVKSAGDGNSGFYVRGGSADQNLVLLDGAPVYNASHLMGFFSVFNGDAIKDFSLYKGNMPAQYGGRLSSALDVRMNEGSTEAYKVSGGIGVIAARLNVEGPLQKGKSSFLVSGRRTYADMFLKLAKDTAIRNNDLNFYDLNVKMNYEIGAKDQVTISGYMGRDQMRFNSSFRLTWGNKIGSLQWKHLFSSRVSTQTSFFYSQYNYSAAITSGKQTSSTLSAIKDLGGKMELQWKSGDHVTRMGVQSTLHILTPGQFVSTSGKTTDSTAAAARKKSVDHAFYFSNTWKPSDKWQLDYGVRFSAFSSLASDSQTVKTYLNTEPRLSGSYLLTNTSTFSFAYSRNVQPLHLLASTTAALPTDQWISSNQLIHPEIADQVSMGYAKKLHNNGISLSVETYYKLLQNQMDYRDGAEMFSNAPVETKVLFGKGRAYGIEWMLKKKKGTLTGWIAYTLSKTERQINGISNNNWYRAKQDRTHELSVVSSLKLSSRWVISANWVFNTGNAVTLPAGKYVVGNRIVYYYTERNGYRMPAYHRLDLSATVQLTQKKAYASELSFGLYNAYGRENAYSIYLRASKTDPTHTEAVQTALFRFVPSVTYNFKF